MQPGSLVRWPSRLPGASRSMMCWVAFVAILGAAILFGAAPRIAAAQSNDVTLTGFVYYDLNGNGQWDPGEPKATSAPVTVGYVGARIRPTATTTDAQGNYTLTVQADSLTYPYGISAVGLNAGGDAVARGGLIQYVPSGSSATLNIGLRFTDEPHPGCIVCDYYSQTEYHAVNAAYFDRRGGVATFGYPISRLFLFQGFPTQIFERAVLQQWPDGSSHLLNLLDPGLLPFTSFNGTIVPGYDPAVIAQAPPGSADYAAQIPRFLTANVPDTFAGLPVRFFQTFQGTVTADVAFPPIPPPAHCQQGGVPVSVCTPPPGYGDPSFLLGFDLEIWGLPTSRPMVDPSNPQFAYQRFQRGIMRYQGSPGVTAEVPIGQYFKDILTGQDLPADVTQEAGGSPYLGQYCRDQPHWICRPDQLDPAANDLTGAFEPEAPLS